MNLFNDSKVFDGKLLWQAVLVFVKANLYLAAHNACFGHNACAFRGSHNAAHTRGDAVEMLIGRLFVAQAAHQSAAAAADFAWVEGQALFLCHFDADRCKVGQKSGTAELLAAHADAAHHFAFIPYADLAQLNSGAEHLCKFLYKLTEVNTAVCSKVKQHFAAVKGVFHINKLHFQLVFFNFFKADFKRLFFVLAVLLHLFHILWGSNACNRFERAHNFVCIFFVHALHAKAAFQPTRCIYNDIVNFFDFKFLRVKKVNLATCFKTNSDNFCHKFSYI